MCLKNFDFFLLKKNKNFNLILDEAEVSGSDNSRDETESENENEYDLKDSFVDQKDYSMNGNYLVAFCLILLF